VGRTTPREVTPNRAASSMLPHFLAGLAILPSTIGTNHHSHKTVRLVAGILSWCSPLYRGG
jgi:hypothetical protein